MGGTGTSSMKVEVLLCVCISLLDSPLTTTFSTVIILNWISRTTKQLLGYLLGIFMCCDEQPNDDGVFCVSSSTEFSSLLQVTLPFRIQIIGSWNSQPKIFRKSGISDGEQGIISS
nr:hypothetical protein CFP56_43063 [Quercus suber]